MLHPYKNKYLPACVELFIAAFSAPPLSYDFIDHINTRRYLRDLTHTPGFAGYIYETSDIIAAFCFGAVDDYFHAPSYEIKELAVSPALHGKGIGTDFMMQLETHLIKKGIAAVTLTTSSTIPAYHFYRKLGYTSTEENVALTKKLS